MPVHAGGHALAEKNKEYLKDGDAIPKWLSEWRLVPKAKVTRSEANDGHLLVAILDKDDLPGMIRLFLALKPWVLYGDFSREAARAARLRARKRALRRQGRKPLRNMRICVTGKLGKGTRPEIEAWLRSCGASISSMTNPKTDVVLVGSHYQGQARKKIMRADQYGIPKLSESAFRRKFKI